MAKKHVVTYDELKEGYDPRVILLTYRINGYLTYKIEPFPEWVTELHPRFSYNGEIYNTRRLWRNWSEQIVAKINERADVVHELSEIGEAYKYSPLENDGLRHMIETECNFIMQSFPDVLLIDFERGLRPAEVNSDASAGTV